MKRILKLVPNLRELSSLINVDKTWGSGLLQAACEQLMNSLITLDKLRVDLKFVERVGDSWSTVLGL